MRHDAQAKPKQPKRRRRLKKLLEKLLGTARCNAYFLCLCFASLKDSRNFSSSFNPCKAQADTSSSPGTQEGSIFSASSQLPTQNSLQDAATQPAHAGCCKQVAPAFPCILFQGWRSLEDLGKRRHGMDTALRDKIFMFSTNYSWLRVGPKLPNFYVPCGFV